MSYQGLDIWPQFLNDKSNILVTHNSDHRKEMGRSDEVATSVEDSTITLLQQLQE